MSLNLRLLSIIVCKLDIEPKCHLTVYRFTTFLISFIHKHLPYPFTTKFFSMRLRDNQRCFYEKRKTPGSLMCQIYSWFKKFSSIPWPLSLNHLVLTFSFFNYILPKQIWLVTPDTEKNSLYSRSFPVSDIYVCYWVLGFSMRHAPGSELIWTKKIK